MRSKSVSRLQRGTETILLAEDDPDIRRMVELVLDSSGYNVVSGSCAEDALEMVADQDDIDLLLTDVRMGRMSGVDLALELREMMPELRVILMSAYADEGQLSRVVDMHFLQKPISPSMIAREVRRVLDEG